jgi:hypothetical protein
LLAANEQRRICKTATNFRAIRAMLARLRAEGVTMTFPGSARLEVTLYFKSLSLGALMFVEVDLTPS